MMLNFKTTFLVLAISLVSGLVMAQSADLTMKWKSDHEYTIRQNITLDMTMPNPRGGGDIATKMNMLMGMKGPSSVDEKGILVQMKFDTIAMSMKMDGKQIMKYDSAKPDPDGVMDKAMAPLLGMNLKILYGKDGKFLGLQNLDEKLLNPKLGLSKDSLETVMKQQSQMIPHREVKVGETWKANLITPMQGFEDGLSCNYDFKLSSINEIKGKQIAKIEFTADMDDIKMKQNGVDMLMSAKNIDGYYLFDIKDGQFTESKVSFDMVAKVQDMDMMMQMNMTIDFGNRPLKK